jgi:hypothetical protein
MAVRSLVWYINRIGLKLLTKFGMFIIRLRKIFPKRWTFLPINLLISFKLLAKRSSANFEHEKITECVRSSVSILVFLLHSDWGHSANTLVGEFSMAIRTLKVIYFIIQKSIEIVGLKDFQLWIILHIYNMFGFSELSLPVQGSADQ